MDIPARTLLVHLAALAPDPVYLVGGSIRDLLSGIQDMKDVDLLMPSGSEDVARRFADDVGGSFFFLDEERKITRVVKQSGNEAFQFDFTNFEGPGLHADLARRDFTMNAMALDLREFLATGSLDGAIDLFNGREDVRLKRIRTADPQVLDHDPLRLLRAVRFAAMLGFTIEQGTQEEIRRRAPSISRPSPERVRDELFLVLSSPAAGAHLRLMEALGLLRVLIPELGPLRDFAPGKHHQYDIFTHSLRAVELVDAALNDLAGIVPQHIARVRAHLDAPLEHGIPRSAALRFACLLHDIAKAGTFSRDEEGGVHFYGHDQIGADAVKGICARFRLSRQTETTVERLVRHHMRPFGLSSAKGPSKRALYRYCRDLRDALPESIILSLADGQATFEAMPAEGFTDTRSTAAVIMEYYYEKFLKTEARPLVTGRDLIALGMRPGPEFRGILEDLREKQAEGVLKDRDEALRHLSTMR